MIRKSLCALGWHKYPRVAYETHYDFIEAWRIKIYGTQCKHCGKEKP